MILHWCRCWLITRTDNIKFGSTDHDADLTINSVLYRSNLSFRGTAIELNNTTGTTQSELSGIFDDDGITEIDLITRKFYEAKLEIFIYNWRTQQKVKTIYTGFLAEIKLYWDSTGLRRFLFDVQSLELKLNQKATNVTTSSCRHEFGNPNSCKFNLASVGVGLTVTGMDGANIISSESGQSSGYFDGGTVEFTSGSLNGLKAFVYAFNNNRFTLSDVPFLPSIGDSFTAYPTCNRSLEDCQGYNNVINFGGQPYIPGINPILTGGE